MHRYENAGARKTAAAKVYRIFDMSEGENMLLRSALEAVHVGWLVGVGVNSAREG